MRRFAARLVIVAWLLGGRALGQPRPYEDRQAAPEPRALVPAYLWDDGAALFVWGALLAREGVDRWVAPPADPVGFSAEEGGAPPARWEVPGAAVTATAGLFAGALIMSDDPARWRHVKGMAQTLSTGAFLTICLKVGFGRRRPDQGATLDAGLGGGSRSFPSGHATQAFEIATYTALYLHAHTFADGSDRLLPAASYAALFGGATLIAAERVWHRRHHVTDVMAGAALGSGLALAFFSWQERRARSASSTHRLWLAPGPGGGAHGVSLGVIY